MAKKVMYLYGKNSIVERVKVNPKSIKKIYIQKNFDTPQVLKLIESARIPISYVSEKELTRVKRADRLQGIVAEVSMFAYTPFEQLLRDKVTKRSFIFLDNLNDPHNLGAIMRITACFGDFAVIIPKHSACGVTDAVMHVASGGENYVPVSMVDNMSTSLIKAKKEGYWIVGTVIDGGENINKVSLPFPLCLVLGSEGKGIRHGIEKQLELKVSLPMQGAQLSLNVAMACAIFCHEIDRQRQLEIGKE